MSCCAYKRQLAFVVALMIAFSLLALPVVLGENFGPYDRPAALGESQPVFASVAIFSERIAKLVQRALSGALVLESDAPQAPLMFHVRACNLEWSSVPFAQHFCIPHSIHAPPSTSIY